MGSGYCISRMPRVSSVCRRGYLTTLQLAALAGWALLETVQAQSASSAELAALQAKFDAFKAEVDARSDAMHVMRSASLVLTMQMGFGMMEAGLVQPKNLVNIMMKNVADTSFSGLSFMLFGWGIAYGRSLGGIVGSDQFFLIGLGSPTDWFFQFTFAATAATIVSGAIAERAGFQAYCIFSMIMTGLVYPVVAHWSWNADGWLAKLGYVDFAGSGVVHMVGGASALTAAYLLGPRRGRMQRVDGKWCTIPFPLGNPSSALTGLFLLWFGWYGFNPGSTLGFTNGLDKVASHVALTTTLGASAGSLTGLTAGWLFDNGVTTVSRILNGTLGGLVGITANCHVIEPWEAMLIGSGGAVAAMWMDTRVVRMGIDDPVSAVAVHLGAGTWSLIATGIFAKPEPTGNYTPVGLIAGSANLMLVQLLAIVVIISWSILCTGTLMFAITKLIPFHVTPEEELFGLDYIEHGMIQRRVLEELEHVVKQGIYADHRRLAGLLIGSAVIDTHELGSATDTLKEWSRIQKSLSQAMLADEPTLGGSPGHSKMSCGTLEDEDDQVAELQSIPMRASVARPPSNMLSAETSVKSFNSGSSYGEHSSAVNSRRIGRRRSRFNDQMSNTSSEAQLHTMLGAIRLGDEAKLQPGMHQGNRAMLPSIGLRNRRQSSGRVGFAAVSPAAGNAESRMSTLSTMPARPPEVQQQQSQQQSQQRSLPGLVPDADGADDDIDEIELHAD